MGRKLVVGEDCMVVVVCRWTSCRLSVELWGVESWVVREDCEARPQDCMWD